ncbi:LOW QUALITY PROTEIN: hypothetical protein YC2023_085819 [Brassica napus]
MLAADLSHCTNEVYALKGFLQAAEQEIAIIESRVELKNSLESHADEAHLHQGKGQILRQRESLPEPEEINDTTHLWSEGTDREENGEEYENK